MQLDQMVPRVLAEQHAPGWHPVAASVDHSRLRVRHAERLGLVSPAHHADFPVQPGLAEPAPPPSAKPSEDSFHDLFHTR
jgi:hypothetical protein